MADDKNTISADQGSIISRELADQIRAKVGPDLEKLKNGETTPSAPQGKPETQELKLER